MSVYGSLAFDQAFIYLLENEGASFTDDPDDSGGATKFGITKATYEHYVGEMVATAEIQSMTADTAKKIYFEKYWKPLKCDQMKSIVVAVAVFDCAVLYGPGTAVLLMQRALSLCGATIKLDGLIGEKTLTILNIVKEGDFLHAFRHQILLRIDSTILARPKAEKFRIGWTKRADRLLTLNNNDSLLKRSLKLLS